MASNSVGLDVATESVVGLRPSFRSQFIQSDTFQFSYGLWTMDYGLWKRDVLTKGVAPQAAPHKRYAFPLRDVHSLAARQSGCALRSVPTVWALSAPREFSYIDARMESLCPCSHAPPSYLALDVSV